MGTGMDMGEDRRMTGISLPDKSERPSAAPMKHYKGIYRGQDPGEIASRTNLAFDPETASFAVRLLGAPYLVPHPEFDMVPVLNSRTDAPAVPVPDSHPEAPAAPVPDSHTESPAIPVPEAHPKDPAVSAPEANSYEKLLIIRYLTEGSYTVPSGKLLSYEELPWGSVYMRNFQGRVIGRLAREFGRGPEAFPDIIESMPGLNYERLTAGDSAYRVEFIDNVFVSLIYYEGDEEFPAAFQMLFDDNVKYAFSAEDVAVVGDVFIERLRAQRNAMRNAMGKTR